MMNPYYVDLGETLYRELFDDYYRPENFTVQQWVTTLLKRYSEGGFEDSDNEF